MTFAELTREYPKACKEIENGWMALEYPMIDEIDVYQLRYYFDSVGLYAKINFSNGRYSGFYFYYHICNAEMEILYNKDCTTRLEAETACILECFKIREKEL